MLPECLNSTVQHIQHYSQYWHVLVSECSPFEGLPGSPLVGMSAATVASLAVEDVPAAAISSLIEGVPICVDAGGSELLADLESSTSCSQLI